VLFRAYQDSSVGVGAIAGVTAKKVLQPHIACTERRARAHPRVLCIQDTSELDYTGKTHIEGLGPLNYEARRGLYLGNQGLPLHA